MLDTLPERIDFEYKRFKIFKAAQSQEELYSSSYEIEVKKNIFCYFTKEKLPFSEKQKRRLMCEINLLDTVFMMMQERHLYSVKDVEVCTKLYLSEEGELA